MLLISSCAHQGIKEEIQEDRISLQAVLDLGRSSYLKGCVDSKHEFAPALKQSVFVKCRELSKKYEGELLEILGPESKTQGQVKN